MDGWSESDLKECPEDKFDRIVHQIAEEARRLRELHEEAVRKRGSFGDDIDIEL